MITAMIRVRSVLFVSAIGILISSSAQAATITVDAGILTGAKNVIVSGVLFDVAFIEGTCAEVFGACDIANFAFTTESDANAASTALFSQVLLDGPQGNFNSDVTLMKGCDHPPQETDQCFAYTPFSTFIDSFNELGVRISVALNTAYPLSPSPLVDDFDGAGSGPASLDTRRDIEGVYAKWTAVPQSVPDHTNTITLLGLSVALILAMRR